MTGGYKWEILGIVKLKNKKGYKDIVSKHSRKMEAFCDCKLFYKMWNSLCYEQNIKYS